MQLRNLVVSMIVFTACSRPIKAGLDSDIQNLLEEFRARMCHPFPEWGIPALDPIQIAHQEIYIENSIFKNFSASITNFSTVGLSSFIINQIKISTLSQKFTFDLTFPLTRIETKYTAKGSLAYIVNLIGDDILMGEVEEVRIIITGAMKIGLSFGIKNLKIQLYINNLFVDFGRLFEHERLNNFFHNLINDLTLELLSEFWQDYGGTYTAKIETLINQKISGYSLKDIIAIISGASENPIFGDDPPADCKTGMESTVIMPKST